MDSKYQHLQTVLSSLPVPFCIAVSGGLDSRFLAWTCNRLGLSFETVLVQGPHLPEPESRSAREWLEGLGLPWSTISFDPLTLTEVLTNPKTRCYFCKQAMFAKITTHCVRRGMRTILEGSQASDQRHFRPGMKALEELNILSPLAECGITKQEIRTLGASRGLSWPDQPSRSCLLARFAYDLVLDHALLDLVAAAESVFLEIGLTAFRFRVLERDRFLLQVHPNEAVLLKKYQSWINDHLHGLGIVHWRLELTTRLSGYFDVGP